MGIAPRRRGRYWIQRKCYDRPSLFRAGILPREKAGSAKSSNGFLRFWVNEDLEEKRMALVRTDPSAPAPSPDSVPSASERITAAFEKLTASAKTINDVSNALAQHVASLERALQRLNIGVACWTKISGGKNQHYEYWSQDVGYARVKGNWCLAIRTVEGHEADPEDESEEVWPFNEAPRWLRVKAVDRLPDLIEALIEATDATTKRLSEKVAPAQELAAAVNALINPKKK